MAAIQKLEVRIIEYFMCMYGGHMCICIPNIKFLCPTIGQGGCAQMTPMMTSMTMPTMMIHDRQSMII